jgi:predicted solute-binding protein
MGGLVVKRHLEKYHQNAVQKPVKGSLSQTVEEELHEAMRAMVAVRHLRNSVVKAEQVAALLFN